MLHGIGLVWLLAKGWHVLNLILYRLAVWTGTVYLYRKGKGSGKRFYYALAVVVYIASWCLLLLGSSKILKLFHKG